MTVREARQIERRFYRISVPSADDEFMYIEAMDYLIDAEHDPNDMMNLGGYYYGLKKFDLALKYYEMAAVYDIDDADTCLGYIWYYGRTGERDYKKAFECFERSMKRGNMISAYKVADMYKNGYYVEKDYDKYVSIIEKLYARLRRGRGGPVADVYTRMARIRAKQGRTKEAVRIYKTAKANLATRLRHNHFFGDLNVMKWLIDDLYELETFDREDFDLYDCYYLLKSPAKISFDFMGKSHMLESLMEDNACVVHFDDKWYRDRDEFFQKAYIDVPLLGYIYDSCDDSDEIEFVSEHLTTIEQRLENFKLLKFGDDRYE